jgi:hypothetical protein
VIELLYDSGEGREQLVLKKALCGAMVISKI